MIRGTTSLVPTHCQALVAPTPLPFTYSSIIPPTAITARASYAASCSSSSHLSVPLSFLPATQCCSLTSKGWGKGGDCNMLLCAPQCTCPTLWRQLVQPAGYSLQGLSKVMDNERSFPTHCLRHENLKLEMPVIIPGTSGVQCRCAIPEL